MISELEDIKDDVLLDLKIRTYNYLSKNLHIKKSMHKLTVKITVVIF